MVSLNSQQDYLEIIEDLKVKLEKEQEYISELELEISKLKHKIMLINANTRLNGKI